MSTGRCRREGWQLGLRTTPASSAVALPSSADTDEATEDDGDENDSEDQVESSFKVIRTIVIGTHCICWIRRVRIAMILCKSVSATASDRNVTPTGACPDVGHRKHRLHRGITTEPVERVLHKTRQQDMNPRWSRVLFLPQTPGCTRSTRSHRASTRNT